MQLFLKQNEVYIKIRMDLMTSFYTVPHQFSLAYSLSAYRPHTFENPMFLEDSSKVSFDKQIGGIKSFGTEVNACSRFQQAVFDLGVKTLHLVLELMFMSQKKKKLKLRDSYMLHVLVIIHT